MDTTVNAEPAPVITIDGPNDWLAAAPGWRPYRDTRWGRHKNAQVYRARQYLAQRVDGGGSGTETVFRRAAVILAARPGAPELERMLGIRAALDLEGQDVRCRDCRKTWQCQPAEPCYEAGPDGGLCLACMLAETRRDVAVPAIEATAVTGPAKPRAKARAKAKADADDADAAGGTATETGES
jgi:hypothetical protein